MVGWRSGEVARWRGDEPNVPWRLAMIVCVPGSDTKISATPPGRIKRFFPFAIPFVNTWGSGWK